MSTTPRMPARTDPPHNPRGGGLRCEGPEPLPQLYPDCYDEEKVELVFDLICDNVSMDKACREHGLSGRSLRRWVERDTPAGIKERYEEVQRLRADKLLDLAMEVADGPDEDEMAALVRAAGGDAKALKALVLGRAQHDRLKVDTIKWAAAKLFPRRFGEKVELGGEVGHKVAFEGMSDAELVVIAQRHIGGGQ